MNKLVCLIALLLMSLGVVSAQEVKGNKIHVVGINEFFPLNLPLSIPCDYSDLPKASKQYKLYDYFNENGVEGIVVAVSDDGYHGKVMSLKQKSWGVEKNFPEEIKRVSFGNRCYINGEYNTQSIASVCRQHGLMGKRTPQFLKYIIELGEGWYIPAYGELLAVVYDVISYESDDKYQALNRKLKQYGGDAFNRTYNYLTSTEFKYRNKPELYFGVVQFNKDQLEFTDGPDREVGSGFVYFKEGTQKRVMTPSSELRAFHRF